MRLIVLLLACTLLLSCGNNKKSEKHFFYDQRMELLLNKEWRLCSEHESKNGEHDNQYYTQSDSPYSIYFSSDSILSYRLRNDDTPKLYRWGWEKKGEQLRISKNGESEQIWRIIIRDSTKLTVISYSKDINSKLITKEYIVEGGTWKNQPDIPNKPNISEKPVDTKLQTKWEYKTELNEMDDSKTHAAVITANELMYFSFPYDGGTSASLWLRKRSKKLDIMLSISQGQFLSSYNHSLLVRFDNKPAVQYTYNEPSDGSSTLIFLNNKAQFLRELKKSKQVLIQCEFYQEGKQTMKFETSGLDWKH